MEALKRNIILLTFMVVPFGYLSPGIVHEGHHLAFVIAFVAITGTLTNNRWICAFMLYMCLWYIFICIFRTLYSIPPLVFVDATNALLYITIGVAIFTAVMKSQLKLDTVLNFICASTLIQCFFAAWQLTGYDLLLRFLKLFFNANALLDESTPIGSMVNPNFFGAYIAITLPLFFRKKWIYAACIPALFIIVSKTTSAFIPALIGIAYFLWPKLKTNQRVAAFVSVVALGLLYAFFKGIFDNAGFHSQYNIMENPRWTIWREALDIWRSSPYIMAFGMGPGASWGQSYPLHNEWLTALYQFGAIGFTLLVGFVVNVPQKNRMLYAAFLIAAVNMFGNYSLHLSPSAFLIIIITGMIYREVRADRVREIRATLDQIKSRKKK